jgi:hypothetical protein
MIPDYKYKAERGDERGVDHSGPDLCVASDFRISHHSTLCLYSAEDAMVNESRARLSNSQRKRCQGISSSLSTMSNPSNE